MWPSGGYHRQPSGGLLCQCSGARCSFCFGLGSASASCPPDISLGVCCSGPCACGWVHLPAHTKRGHTAECLKQQAPSTTASPAKSSRWCRGLKVSQNQLRQNIPCQIGPRQATLTRLKHAMVGRFGQIKVVMCMSRLAAWLACAQDTNGPLLVMPRAGRETSAGAGGSTSMTSKACKMSPVAYNTIVAQG